MYTIINGVWQRSMKLHELVLLRNELQKAIELSTIKLELEKNKASLQSMATLVYYSANLPNLSIYQFTNL